MRAKRYWYCVARARDGVEVGKYATIDAAIRHSKRIYALVYLRQRTPARPTKRPR